LEDEWIDQHSHKTDQHWLTAALQQSAPKGAKVSSDDSESEVDVDGGKVPVSYQKRVPQPSFVKVLFGEGTIDD